MRVPPLELCVMFRDGVAAGWVASIVSLLRVYYNPGSVL